MDQRKISCDGAKATVELQGGRLASLEIGGNEVLVTHGPKPTRWGSFPMVPWCGRLPDGKLHYADNVYQFPLTSPDSANHGLAHIQPWRVIQHSDSVLKIGTDLTAPWTFGGSVTQRFELDDNAMLIEIQIEADEWAMPVMAGWHPWFRRRLDIGDPAQLLVEPGRQYQLDENKVPTGALGAVGPQPWDDCFIDLAAPPTISWPGAFDLTISSSFDHWVIFTEPTNAICVEPQSGPPNEINRAPKIIDPGQRFFGWMGMTWTSVQGVTVVSR
jgi:aldose 1-epimerase